MTLFSKLWLKIYDNIVLRCAATVSTASGWIVYWKWGCKTCFAHCLGAIPLFILWIIWWARIALSIGQYVWRMAHWHSVLPMALTLISLLIANAWILGWVEVHNVIMKIKFVNKAVQLFVYRHILNIQHAFGVCWRNMRWVPENLVNKLL